MGWINLRESGVKDSLILKFMKEFKNFDTFLRDENIRILDKDMSTKDRAKRIVKDVKKLLNKNVK